MQGVEHYLVDVLEPEEEFHIVKFQEMAKAAMEEIYAKGKVPILVGGTGFYIQAVTRDIDFTDHGRPKEHPNPHQHDYIPNPTGGTLQHGPAKDLEIP